MITFEILIVFSVTFKEEFPASNAQITLVDMLLHCILKAFVK